MIKAVINVEAPRQQVFDTLIDFACYTKWVPGCERCDIVRASGNVTDVEVSMNSIRRAQFGLRFESEPTQSIRFRMTHGKDLKAYFGTYRLMDSANHNGTVLIAELEIDAGYFAPKFIVNRLATQVLEDTGKSLSAYVRSIGHQPPPRASGSRAEHRKKRDKRIIRVVATPSGYRMWLYGKSFLIDGRNR